MNYRDRVHPELLEIYDSAEDFDLDFPDFVRTLLEEEFKLKGLPKCDSVEVYEQSIDSSLGENTLTIRIYRPAGNNDLKPGLLWIHGGGYIAGFAKQDEGLCIRFVNDLKCCIVSVDYHLAPEFPYPIPIEDCYSALNWFHENADELNVDKSRIAVAGLSAGGGLTAALSLLCRDRGGPPILFQMPLYPMIDDLCATPSCLEMQDLKFWSYKSNKMGWALYLGDNTDDVSPYAAPSRAEDYSNLPPTYTCIGDLDPLRDETIEYVLKLSQAGVPVEFHLYPGCFHAFDVAIIRTEIGDRAQDEYVNALARAFRKEY
jgi:acetyl esterase/lipase